MARAKSVNEDYFWIDQDKRFMIIADGMGGHYGGSIASQTAVMAIAEYLDREYHSTPANMTLLEAGFNWAHEMVLNAKKPDERLAEMGSTLLALLIRPSKHGSAYTLGSIGDSRLYCINKQSIEQKTRDDTVIQRAIELGQIRLSEARSHPLRHVLTQCIGQSESYPKPFLMDINISAGDILIMVTDGVYQCCDFNELVPQARSLENIGSELDLVVDLIHRQLLEISPSDDATSIVIGFSAGLAPNERAYQ